MQSPLQCSGDSPALADFENQVFHNMGTFTETLDDGNIRVVLVYTRRQLRLSETDDNLKIEGDIHGITAVVIDFIKHIVSFLS